MLRSFTLILPVHVCKFLAICKHTISDCLSVSHISLMHFTLFLIPILFKKLSTFGLTPNYLYCLHNYLIRRQTSVRVLGIYFPFMQHEFWCSSGLWFRVLPFQPFISYTCESVCKYSCSLCADDTKNFYDITNSEEYKLLHTDIYSLKNGAYSMPWNSM